MSDYQIRVATLGDLETICRHRRRMYEDMGYTDSSALDAVQEAARPLLGRGLTEGTYRGWLVEARGGIAVAGGGLIFLEFQSNPRDPRPERVYVVNMFTEPEHRRRGLARLLVETMVEHCRKARLLTLYLHASAEGRPLYESLGFEPTNEMRLTLPGPPQGTPGR